MQKAEETFKKALEVNPESVESMSALGRIYYNQAVNKQGEANMINDSKKYQEELTIAKRSFQTSSSLFPESSRNET